MAENPYPLVGLPAPEDPGPAYGVPPGYGVVSDDDGGNLQDYVRVLYRRRWPTIGVFVAVAMVMALSSYRQVSLYEGRAQLLIELEQPKVLNFQSVSDSDSNGLSDFYPTQYKMLESRSLVKKAVDSLNLWNHPEFVGQKNAPSVFAFSPTAFVTDHVKQIVRAVSPAKPAAGPDVVASVPAATPIDAVTDPSVMETPQQARVIDGFIGRLTIAPVKESRLVDVKFRSTDPILSANAANGLAKAYIEQTMEFKFDTSKEASEWLDQRLSEQRQKVEASENALQQYREQSDSVALDDHANIVVQKLTDLNAAVTRAKMERLSKEAAYVQVQKAKDDPEAMASLPVVLAHPLVQQVETELAGQQRQQAEMSKRIGEKHPDMAKIRADIEATQTKLRVETAKVVQSVQSDYQAAVSQEQSLTAALEAQKRDALDLNRKSIAYGVLQRDAESNRLIYNNLLQRAKEANVSENLRASNIRIVDYAQLPRGPVFPNHQQDLIIAICTALVCALGTALFLEYLDSRIKTPDEIKSRLGLPYLGLLPDTARKVLNGKPPMINNGVPPTFSEAFRHVRTSVLFSLADEGPKSLLVTSTGPGEGKSMVSTNLAIALAQAGNRVLIMDADLRRPKAHEAFGEKLEPGLSNVMTGNAKPSESIVKTSVPNLWILPAGHRPPNPAELLGSKRFRETFKTVAAAFDFVVVDSPPLLAVTDAATIAHLVNGVVFVVGSEMTNRQAAQLAIERLRASGATVLGGLLNRVDLTGNGYYYSKYYHRRYESYYSQSA